jgi:hypothetical protein
MGNATAAKHDTSLSLALISGLKVTNRLINLHHKTHMCGIGQKRKRPGRRSEPNKRRKSVKTGKQKR